MYLSALYSSLLMILTISHVTWAQFAVGFSPTAQVGRNHLGVRPAREEQGKSTCIDWRSPTTMDKLVAPYAQRLCNSWSPLTNGNGAGNAVPGFGYAAYSPYNGGGGYYGASYGGNGFNSGFANPYNVGASYGSYVGGNGFGGGFGSPVGGFAAPSPYYRPF